jgi:uncharacterized protein YtpQ (UPF0354 family)
MVVLGAGDMRRVVGLLIAAFLFCSAALAQTLAPQAFTERFAQALGAAVPSATVTIRQDLQLTLKRADGSSADVNLTNIYGEYKGQPERFDDLVAVFANALKNPVPPKLERTRIVPMIKDRAWLDEIAPIFQKRGSEPLFESFNKELVVAYAEDSDTRARYLDAREDVGDRNDLRALAVSNLKRILPKIMMRMHDDELAIITAGGNYEPSLLLFEDIWSSGQIKVDGDIVVAIPARDTLLVTGSKSRKGLKNLRGLVAKLADGPYRITTSLFVYRAGRFVRFGAK